MSASRKYFVQLAGCFNDPLSSSAKNAHPPDKILIQYAVLRIRYVTGKLQCMLLKYSVLALAKCLGTD